jgi:hypothetical protein
MNFCDVHAELIALFENSLAAGFYEVVELDGELCHAVAQLVEAEIDRGEGVSHGRRVSGQEGWAHSAC